MQRLMEENRQMSAAKIKSLTSEVEELRPANTALHAEIASLRRHLALALGELKNPIVLPPPRSLGSPDFEQEEWFGEDDGIDRSIPAPTDDEGSDDDSDSGYDEGDHDELAQELQDEAQNFLKDLGMFRKKVGTDVERFGMKEALAEIIGH
jgi:hypothetical protein